MSAARCDICRRPVTPEYRPFCSRRCADVDLQRWLSGAYVVPVDDDESPDGGVPVAGDDDES
jgi:endogenous inhibitor of DNA gyrase (YacG/DUF329 family)